MTPAPARDPDESRAVEVARTADIRLLTLRDGARLMARRIGLIAAVTLAGLAGVSALVLRMPNYYDASARIEINPESSQLSTAAPSTPIAVDPAYINTQIQMITSPGLLRRVVISLDLEHDPVFVNHMSKGGRLLRRLMLLDFLARVYDADLADVDTTRLMAGQATPYINPAEARSLEPFVEDLRARITILPVQETRSVFRETRLVDVTLRHQSPALAARLANGVVNALVRGNEEQTTEGDRVRLSNLMRRALELQQEIRRSEAKLAAYANAHDIVSIQPDQNTDVEGLISLSRQLLEAQNQLRLAEADYASATEPSAAAALAEDGVRASLAGTNEKLADLRARRAQLLVTATEKWPEVKEVQRQIDVLEQHAAEVKKQGETNAVAKAKARLAEARIREQEQRTAFEQQRAALLAQNGASVTYKLMQQGIDTNKKILNGLLETVGANEANKAVSINNLRVIDFATPPDKGKPQGPFRIAYIGLAGFISLGFGIAAALLLAHLDDRIWTDEDIRETLGIRPLGGISPANRRPLSFLPFRTPDDGTLITNDRNFNMAEDYLRLRTSVLRASPRTPHSLLVSSSVEGEGKTTTAANAAISIARMGARVVLVDADLHCPRQHVLFGFEGGVGLSSILTGETAMNDAEMLLHQDRATGIYILPAGVPIADAAERLGGQAMRQLLAELGRRFEYVIVDAPSIQSRVDALLLAPAVDGVVMVIQAGKSRRDVVRRSRREIEGAGGKLLGVVLNNAQSPVRRKYSEDTILTARRSA